MLRQFPLLTAYLTCNYISSQSVKTAYISIFSVLFSVNCRVAGFCKWDRWFGGKDLIVGNVSVSS